MSGNREWGGCLPTELHVRFPSAYKGFDVQGYNTGRAAILAAVLDMGAKRVWLPYYLCPTVRDFLDSQGVSIIEYHIDNSFFPLIDRDCLKSDDAVVWTNWLGAVPSATRECVLLRFRDRLILDNCHACFDKPAHGVYNVYSLRKVAGLPHGAFLVADEPKLDVGHLDFESIGNSLDYLETSRMRGSNAAYQGFLENSHNIGCSFRLMNPLVSAAFAGLDWSEIALLRRRNLGILRELLGDSAAAPCFDLDSGLPIWFPLYVEDEKLREGLLQNNVWVPRLWRRILEMPEATDLESRLARWLLPLPIDQRYDESDMQALGSLVVSVL